MIFRKLVTSILITAIALGGGSYVVDRRAIQQEALARAAYPPTGQFVTVNGTRIHAHIEGSGPDLVLIHGAGGNTRDFSFDLAGKLARTYRVIAFDRPGMGWSDDMGAAGEDPANQARLLKAAAIQLGVTDPIVLGHSYGGAVAMAWALQDPSAIHAVVLVAGATMPFPGEVNQWYKLTGSRIAGGLIRPLLTAFATSAQAETSIDAVFQPDLAPKGYAGYIGAGLTLRRQSLETNGRQVLALKQYLVEMSARYASLTLPVEILHGTSDTTVPPDIHAIPLSKLLPNATLTLIDGAGHMPHHSHPDQIIAAIDRVASS